MRPSSWTVRLAMLAGVALASCVIPADTAAQQCDGVTIRDRGTDICVATEAGLDALAARIDSLISEVADLEPGGSADSLRSELAAHLRVYAAHAAEFGTLRDRVAAEAARTGVLEGRLDSLITALGDTVVVPPPDTTGVPGDTTDVPPGDTTTVLPAPSRLETTAESGTWWASWSPVSGADDYAVRWVDRDTVLAKAPNARNGLIWLPLGDVGALEGEDACVAGRVGGVEGVAKCRTIGGTTEPPPEDSTIVNPPPPPPPPPPSGTEWGMGGHRAGITWNPPNAAPDLSEDWTAYTSLDDWMARSPLPWRDHGQTLGYYPLGVNIHPAGDGTPHAGRGLMLRYRTGTPCRADNMANIGPELSLPPGDTLWAEVTFSTSPNFTTRSPTCEAQGIRRFDHKTFLVWVTTDSTTCSARVCTERPEYKIGSHMQIEARVPYGATVRDSVVVGAHSVEPYCWRDQYPNIPDINGDGSISVDDCRHHPPRTVDSDLVDPRSVWDGNEHTFRFYVARCGVDCWELAGWIDGVQTHDYRTYVDEPGAGVEGLRYALFGSNRNTSADEDMWFYFRSFRIWAR